VKPKERNAVKPKERNAVNFVYLQVLSSRSPLRVSHVCTRLDVCSNKPRVTQVRTLPGS
jgi:hypothetical protein